MNELGARSRWLVWWIPCVFALVSVAACGTDAGPVDFMDGGTDGNPGNDGNVGDDGSMPGTPAVVVDAGNPLRTTEKGGSDSFGVSLASKPSADVTVPLASTDDSEGAVSPASLTFTPDNWNAPQAVQVTGVDDDLADGDITFRVEIGPATSADSGYDGLEGADVTVRNSDDDTAGVLVDAADDLSTTEEGGQANFSVLLLSAPTSDVVISIQSGDEGEGQVTTTELTFTPLNWGAAQKVVVTGVDDEIADGPVDYMITVGPVTSSDTNYQGLNSQTVVITNVDDDSAGVTLIPGDSATTTEAGGQADFGVRLNSQPNAAVVINVEVSPGSEAEASTDKLIFSVDNWAAPQSITLTGLDDDIQDGDQPVTVTLIFDLGSDPTYAALAPVVTGSTNIDNDTAGFTVTPTEGLSTSEQDVSSGGAEFSVVLNAQPTHDVVVSVASNAVDEAEVSVTSLTFTPDNWNAPQQVNVIGQDDDVDDGDQPFTILLGVMSTEDANYALLDPSDVSGSNVDNETAGVSVQTPEGDLRTKESDPELGGSAKVQVRLNSQPTGIVTLDVSVGPSDEVTADKTSLVFTSDNWTSFQDVTLKGVDDLIQDGDQQIRVRASVDADNTEDEDYKLVVVEDLLGLNEDNDQAGVDVEVGDDQTSEDGETAEFMVRLLTQPSTAVVIPVTTASDEGTPSPLSLTFSTTDWAAPQTVTVTGADDDVQDGSQQYTIVLGNPTGGDANYEAIDPVDVTLTNLDNDSAAITVDAAEPVETGENGDAGTFTIRLASKPVTGDVTILLRSTNTDEGVLEAGSERLKFTQDSWNAPQTVTVLGVNDDVDDGNQTYAIEVEDVIAADSAYSALALEVIRVEFSNLDDDIPGITVNPTSGLTTTEAEGTAEFVVVLNSEPTHDVTIPLSIPVADGEEPEGILAVNQLVFTSLNWNAPQKVIVTGVDDDVQDGGQLYSVVLGLATSDDAGYLIDPPDVSLTNTDNDSAGYTVTPTEGLETDEKGQTAQFTVRLNSQPLADVTFSVTSSDLSEGTVNKASLTFTTNNWNAPQSVTVKGVSDSDFDGDQPYEIELGAAMSSDGQYDSTTPPKVFVTNLDDDPGVRVTPLVLTVREAGQTSAEFTVRLNTQPAQNVTLSVDAAANALGDPTDEGTLAPNMLTFTPDNWNAPQPVTVTAADDLTADGDQDFVALTSATMSMDTSYDNLPVENVTVTNVDNDEPGITVVPSSGLVTGEDASTATFSVVLDTVPTHNVVISFESDDDTEGSVNPSSVTFTPTNWNGPRTITVRGLDDLVDDGDQPYRIVINAAESDDPNYQGRRDTLFVDVRNTDDETAGIIVEPLSLVSREDGTTKPQFTIRLQSKPLQNVQVTVSSTDLGEGDVSPKVFDFTPDNWNAPQPATVTGVDDDPEDGPQPYTIIVHPATSDDAGYDGKDGADVSVLNTDDDGAGVTVTPPEDPTTTELGGETTFTIVLDSQPTQEVTIYLTSSNPNEGTVNPEQVVFTPDNWNSARTITVQGQDDDVADSAQVYTIFTSAAESTDPNYSGKLVADVVLTNTDNETAGFEVSPQSGLSVRESGTTATFTMRLTSKPTASVTVVLSSPDTGEVRVSPAFFVFTDQNWNGLQTATLTGQDDSVIDGEQIITIATSAADTSDNNYKDVDPPDVQVSVQDDEGAGLRVVPDTGLQTSEEGGEAVFGVALISEPAENVTVFFASSNTDEGTVAPASLEFTPQNWNALQDVTITGEDDDVRDDNQQYKINLTTMSMDGNYDNLSVPDVSVENVDDETASIRVIQSAGLTTNEAGTVTANFEVRLNSQPTDKVTLTFDVSNALEGSLDKTMLEFDAGNWSDEQTVTISGVDDNVADNNVPYSVVFDAADSNDSNYQGKVGETVFVTNLDDDSPNIVVTPTLGLITSENETTGQFSVVLTSEPVGNVVISLSVSADEGTLDKNELQFTDADWDVPQVVTVTGVDDGIQDGAQQYFVTGDPSASTDADYAGKSPFQVEVTNTDND